MFDYFNRLINYLFFSTTTPTLLLYLPISIYLYLYVFEFFLNSIWNFNKFIIEIIYLSFFIIFDHRFWNWCLCKLRREVDLVISLYPESWFFIIIKPSVEKSILTFIFKLWLEPLIVSVVNWNLMYSARFLILRNFWLG